jgi:hypothetical protein
MLVGFCEDVASYSTAFAAVVCEPAPASALLILFIAGASLYTDSVALWGDTRARERVVYSIVHRLHSQVYDVSTVWFKKKAKTVNAQTSERVA